jgi:putative oxidoreductase
MTFTGIVTGELFSWLKEFGHDKRRRSRVLKIERRRCPQPSSNMKVGGSPVWISRFAGWGYPAHFYLAIGLAELCGAAFLLIPQLARSGALLLIGIMIGATVTHLLHREPQVVTTLVLTALLVGVVYLRRTGLAGALQAS